jgi:hypothetical protein
MIELTQIINKGNFYYNQAVNAQTELFHSMELGANDQGNTDTDSLGEWWTFCLEEYKEGYDELSFILGEFKPYLKKHKFEYVTNDEDSDLLTVDEYLEYVTDEEDSDLLTVEECLQEEEYLIAKKAHDNLSSLFSDLTKSDDLVNKANLELMYLE